MNRYAAICLLAGLFVTVALPAQAATASVDGALIPTVSSIVDSSGATWTISAGTVKKNGAAAGSSANVTSLLYLGGSIYQENTSANWFAWSGSQWGGKIADPRVASASGTKVPSAAHIVDTGRNVWTISGGVVYRNGVAAGFSSGVTLLEYYSGTFYQENSAKNFYAWNGTTWLPSGAPGSPAPSPTSSTLPVSPGNSTIPSLSQIVDNAHNVWTLVGGVVKENGSNAGSTSGVVQLLYWGALIYQENSAGLWWSWNSKTWVAVAGDPRNPTPTPTQTSSTAQTGMHVAMDDLDEFTPLSSWANAMTKYGAKGDGTTNDAPALQNALNNLGKSGQPSVLYLPAGTYKIESTLTFTAPYGTAGGVTIVGASPSTTILKWAGPSGGAMIYQNGGFGMLYSRMTLDGNSTAGFGIKQWWANDNGQQIANGPPYAGSSEHVDMVFKNMAIGIMGGSMANGCTTSPMYCNMDSEGKIRRVTFQNISYSGLSVGSGNAVDWWIWDSQFINCARGASALWNGTGAIGSNDYALGNFHVYRSLFLGSTVADLQLHNSTFWYGVHQNVSIGSKQFLLTDATSLNGSFILEGNRIVNTTNPVAITMGLAGPFIMIDNEVRSASGSGPAVELTAKNAQFISINNKYSVATHYTTSSSTDSVYSFDDSTVSTISTAQNAAPLSTSTSNGLPPTPTLVTRSVVEVAAGASGAAIQTAINQAVSLAKAGAINPIVHLPPATYGISTSLTIPAETRIQIVGDGDNTALNWGGSSGGYVFTLAGPSYATIRDLKVESYCPGMNSIGLITCNAGSVLMTGADQTGGRVFILGSEPGHVTASNLAHTQISAQENTGLAGISLTNVAAMTAVSTGGISAVQNSNSNLLIADTWYEGKPSQLYRVSGGTTTTIGEHMSPADGNDAGSALAAVPAFQFTDFSGSACFIGVQIDNAGEKSLPDGLAAGTSIYVDGQNSSTNIAYLGPSAGSNTFYEVTGSGGNVGLIEPRGGSSSLTPYGNQSTTWVNSMLSPLRSVQWDVAPYNPPAGATNVRLYRFIAPNTSGISVSK